MIERSMNWRDHIVVNPDICHGKPCFKGTRVPVSIVLANLAAGADEAELLRDYPSLPGVAVGAALAYAAELSDERVIPLFA